LALAEAGRCRNDPYRRDYAYSFAPRNSLERPRDIGLEINYLLPA
jgi:hypothetical protein